MKLREKPLAQFDVNKVHVFHFISDNVSYKSDFDKSHNFKCSSMSYL